MRWLPLLLVVACGGKSDSSPEGSVTVPTGDTTTTATGTGGTTSATGCEGVTPKVTELTAEELHTMLDSKDFDLINVHIPNAGEIPGTDVHIAYTDAAALEARLGTLDAKAVLYCKTGPMSAIATADLVDKGYCNIYDLPSGMIGWENAGYTIDP